MRSWQCSFGRRGVAGCLAWPMSASGRADGRRLGLTTGKPTSEVRCSEAAARGRVIPTLSGPSMVQMGCLLAALNEAWIHDGVTQSWSIQAGPKSPTQAGARSGPARAFRRRTANLARQLLKATDKSAETKWSQLIIDLRPPLKFEAKPSSKLYWKCLRTAGFPRGRCLVEFIRGMSRMAILASLLTHHLQVGWRAAPHDHAHPHPTHRARRRSCDVGRRPKRCWAGGAHAGLP